MTNANENINFARETKQKIGAVTYIVAAHFDENKETLYAKIAHLLLREIDIKITNNVIGHGQNDVV